MDATAGKKINELKAPMPGLVLRVTANEGEAVKKGDTLLVLEAMKMENSIKSPGDGMVAKIMVKPGQAVEKNQLLVVFG
jgi:biotin carboxyl carrier protein